MELSADQMYKDLIEAERPVTLQEDEFTLNQFAKDTGLSASTARRRLANRVDRGELESFMRIIDGHERRIYRFVETPSETEE